MIHLLKILEVKHMRGDEVLWESSNLLNTFHLEGERFILTAMFKTTAGITIPSFYYLGMDNRSSLSVTDNIQSITTEPTGNGYSRQPVSSATGWEIENYTVSNVTHWRIKSRIVTFNASGGSWGPVSNVFLTDRLDNTGYLISSVALESSRTLAPADALNFRFLLKLVNDD